MSYFLSGVPLVIGRNYELRGEEARHIVQVRRIKKGEHLNLQGPDEKRFEAEVISVERAGLTVSVRKEITTPPEPALAITLFQVFVSEQPLDYILQKSTELGASAIVLFYSERSPHQLGEKLEKKFLRWQKILQEAAKQCDRVRSPKLEFIPRLADVLVRVQQCEQIFLLEPTGKAGLSPEYSRAKPVNSIGIFIGPEGGFTKEEVATISALPNATAARLGPRILRAETAATSALAIAQALWGDMRG